MKRVFTILFALSLAITASSPFFTVDGYAANKNKEAEATTQSEANDTTQAKEETQSPKLPATGASYNINEFEDGPDITAGSAILMDARSGAVLYAKDAEAKRYPASITKVMTTLLAIENSNMSDIVTFSKEAVYGIEAGSSSAGIDPGAQLTMEETLYALMLVSANEAGAAIAEHVAGSNEAFAELMTKRAKEIGCTGTQFRNPHGLPDEEHYTTAHDMGRIMQECIKHEEFRKISSTLTYTIEQRDTLPRSIELVNHAKILRSSFPDYYYEYAVGAKTGFTHAALNTLVTFAEKDGVQLLCVILKDQGADCSYYDTKALYEWGFQKVKTVYPYESFDLNEALSSDESFKQKQVNKWLELEPEFTTDYPVLIRKNDDNPAFKTIFRLDEDAPNGRLGYVDLQIDGETVNSVPVTYDTSKPAAQEYISKQEKEDKISTAKSEKKAKKSKKSDSLLHRMFIYSVRILIACILIYLIMTFIHKYLDDKKRTQRKNQRRRPQAPRGNTSGKSPRSGNSSGKSAGKPNGRARGPRPSSTSSRSVKSSASGNKAPGKSTGKNSVTRNRRHK